MPVCLSIQSQVVAGHVGHGASAVVLAAAGVEVWPLPTVVLSGHAATAGVKGRRLPGEEIAALAEGLAASGALDRVDAVLTGYLGSPEAGEAVAALVAEVKRRRPGAVYLCDPVLGDNGRLYLPEAMVALYRERLLPLADIATPNTDEAGWLAGSPHLPPGEAAARLRRLGPGTVFVTSVRAGREIGILAATETGQTLVTAPRVDRALHGAGDFVSALLLGEMLRGGDAPRAAERATAAAARLAGEAVRLGRDDLPVIAARELWQA